MSLVLDYNFNGVFSDVIASTGSSVVLLDDVCSFIKMWNFKPALYMPLSLRNMGCALSL